MHPANMMVLLIAFLAAILFAGLIWVAGDILALFLIGFLLAYLLHPLVSFLSRHGLPRGLSAFLVTVALSVIIVGAFVLLGPLIYAQMGEVLEGVRKLLTAAAARATDIVAPYFPAARDFSIEHWLYSNSVEKLAAPVAGTVLKGGMALATTVGIVLLIPVVMFYLLKDWPSIWKRMIDLIAPRQRAKARALGREIDRILAGFLHGQAWVCLCVGSLYSLGLLAVGLHVAIAIGVASGVLKFLPYIGTAIGTAAALTAAYMQGGWDQWLMLGVIAVYLVVEFIETSFLSPRIIGARVKMPPALVIFAVLLGAKLLGIIGVFLAVPTFAVGRAILSFWLAQNRRDEA
jgi:predicted PurR-regulated permease PerM